MKTQIYNTNGEKKGSIELPKVFETPVRKDIIAKVVESKKLRQPYSQMFMAGRQNSASGIVQHRRHVWKSGYGRGASRTPRKIMSARGSQFNWVGAEAPHTRGGRRCHPPKVAKMINFNKINKKEMQLALMSAIAATANENFVIKRYSTLQDKKLKLELPFVVESGILNLKTKEILNAMKKILGENLFDIALKKKSIRSGKGKMRGRPYKVSAGILIVTGEKEKMKTKNFDSVSVNALSIMDIAETDSPGRLTIYTENAIKDMGEKFK